MAQEKGKSYPKIPQATWFGLREKLKQRVPGEISASYVASAMGMAEASANANVIAPLKVLGIIGDDGKPTDMAWDWRDDTKYPQVCEQIIEATYPQELRDLFHSPDSALAAVTAWFMRSAKVGESAARKYGQTYLMLLQGDLTAAAATNKKQRSTKPPASSSSPKKVAPKKEAPKKPEQREVPPAPQENGFVPRLHIDVQVHISPDSTPEQIDKIFEAMAKHLKGFKS